MKEERMYILNLLGDGKISAEEAENLLKSLSSNRSNYEDKCQDVCSFAESVENFAKDCGSKFKTTFKSMEPAVRRTTKSAMEKTVSILDDIAKSLNENIKNMEEKLDEHENCDCGCECDDKDDNEPKEN